MNLLLSEMPDLIGAHLRHRNSPSIKGGKFDLVAVAAFIDVNDRPDITNRKPVIGKASDQRHAVQLFDHADKGYAVIKRGASLPVSTSQTVRTHLFILVNARQRVIWRR